MPLPAFAVHDTVLFQVAEHLAEVFLAEAVALLERQLEGRAADMIEQDQQLVGIDARLLGRGAEEELGVADNVLVQRQTARHQHAQRGTLPPAGTTQALPGAGDGARVAVQQAHVQRTDVHAQLQRRGGYHAVDGALAQLLLHGAPFGRQVTAAIGRDAGGGARVVVEGVLHVLGEHFDHQPRLRKHNALQPALDRHFGDARGL